MSCSLLLLVAAVSADPLEITGRVVSVYDGDTIWILSEGQRVKIRLHGIDAPEIKQPHGIAARDALAAMVTDRDVTVVLNGRTHRKRVIGRVLVAGDDAGLELVRAGHAWYAPEYYRSVEYSAAAIDATEAHRGLWATPCPISPREWRDRR